MKKVILIILSLSLLLCGCSIDNNINEKTTIQPFIKNNSDEYVKSVWITYYELRELIGNRNEDEFKKNIDDAFKELYSMGFNSVTVQVRAFADAFYKSDYYPLSKYCFGKQGGEMKYDVLKILCESAKENNLRVEAWINPYRVSFDNDIKKLSDNNIAKKWYKGNKKSNVYVCKSGIYFNPASKDVTKLIVKGAVEIVKNYDVDSIHFDDYFYPDTTKKIDYQEYKKYGDNSSLSNFRRKCVSNMIKEVNNSIKAVNKDIEFCISPAANIENDYNTLYADVEKWACDSAYCDSICPQIYFGFKNVTQPFMFTVKKWLEISKNRIYVGLPLYKCGRKDKYAALNDSEAINEFINNDKIIARQINYLAKIENIKGFYVFSYSSLFDEKCKKEVENMIKSIQSTHPNQLNNL